ncbi:MAG: hypothetical protein LBB79_10015 [Prevotellaceae bacterium]|nr:hypothetical protein [Prevotellaceae bacterium]
MTFEEAFEIYATRRAVKRFESYESIGSLFRQAKAESLELHIKERIYLIIIELITKLADFFEIDIDFFTKQIIADNEKLINLLNFQSLNRAIE